MGVISSGGGGLIYAALFSDGLVKIGCTRNEAQRIASLKSTRPYEMLKFVSAISHENNLRSHESCFHKLFDDKHVKGEFFRFTFGDWLHWFLQWNSLEWAQDVGLLLKISQYYDRESNEFFFDENRNYSPYTS